MGEFLRGIPGELDALRGDQWERPFGKGHNDMRETTGQTRTAICYCSLHHGNTKKLLDAIASRHEVTLIDVKKGQRSDLAGYDRIGLASGIYYGKFAKQLLEFAKVCLPESKAVFFIATCGACRQSNFNSIKNVADQRHCKVLGQYLCLGFDSFGPLRLIGGIHRKNPTQEEIDGAVRFYEGLPA